MTSTFLVIKVLVAITFPLPRGMLKHLGSSGQRLLGKSVSEQHLLPFYLFQPGTREGGEDTIDPPDGVATTAAAAAAFPLSISVTSTYVHQPNRYSTQRLVSLDSTAHSYFRRTSTVTREQAHQRNPIPFQQPLLSLI